MKTRTNWHVGQEGIYRRPTGSLCSVVLLLKFSFLVIYFERFSFPTTLKTLNTLFILLSTREVIKLHRMFVVCGNWPTTNRNAVYQLSCCLIKTVNYVQMNAAEIKTHTCMQSGCISHSQLEYGSLLLICAFLICEPPKIKRSKAKMKVRISPI